MNKYLWLSLVFVASPAFAQKFTVKKVKGTQAIVEVSEGVVVTGKTYDLGAGDGGGDLEFTASSTGRRSKFIGFSAQISSIKSDTGGTTNQYGASGIYGWNLGTIEYGVGGSFLSKDTGTGAAMSYGVLGKFDFNLMPNRSGVTMVYGVGAQAGYDIANPAGGGTAVNTISAYPSAFLKWFPLGNSACVRTDLGYSYAQASVSGTKSTLSGVAIAAGFEVYF